MSFVYVCMLSHIWLFATPWTVACQASLSWNFPGKNTGLGCHFLLQGIFPGQGSDPCLLRLLCCRQTLHHCAPREAWVLCMRRAVAFVLMELVGSAVSHTLTPRVRVRLLRPHRLQHARLPCPSLSPWVCSLVSIELTMPSNRLILCRPLLLLPSVFPSIRVFSSESALRIRGPKYWSLSFSISPSNEYSV